MFAFGERGIASGESLRQISFELFGYVSTRVYANSTINLAFVFGVFKINLDRIAMKRDKYIFIDLQPR